MTAKFQEERQRRMLATDDTSDEDNEEDEKSSSQRPKSISGDDLGDSFSIDEEPKPKRGWVDEVLERKDMTESEEEGSSEDSDDAEEYDVNEESDEDNDAGEKATTLKDWEQSDDDDLGTDLEEEEDEKQELDDDSADDEEQTERKGSKKLKATFHVEIEKKESQSLDKKKIKADHAQPSAQPDIPFLIDVPKSLEEFCALMENFSNAEKIVVINRIRASNAIKLAAENRKKMQVRIFMQFFCLLSSFCSCAFFFCVYVVCASGICEMVNALASHSGFIISKSLNSVLKFEE